MVLLFLIALAISIFIFASYNQRLHQQSRQGEYEACLADKQIARNQREVLKSLIVITQGAALAISPSTRRAAEIELPRLWYAYRHVPHFVCRK